MNIGGNFAWNSAMFNPYYSANNSQRYIPSSLINYGNAMNRYPRRLMPALAREYVLRLTHAQYEQELLRPYREYIQYEQPFLKNSYL
jgi:hypothetical protein